MDGLANCDPESERTRADGEVVASEFERLIGRKGDWARVRFRAGSGPMTVPRGEYRRRESHEKGGIQHSKRVRQPPDGPFSAG